MPGPMDSRNRSQPSIFNPTASMQSFNPVTGASTFGYNETTSPNHAPGTSSSCASTACWSGPIVNGPSDECFPGGFALPPEFFVMQNSGHQHHVNDNTAFQSIPENSMLLHSETADDRTSYYPQDLWYLPLEDNNLTQAYVWNQYGQLPLFNSGTIPPSLQTMMSQSSTEPLPIMMPSQEQSALSECAWIEDGKRCDHPISHDKRKLSTHLRNFHGVYGPEKKPVVCFWQGCDQNMQRGAIGRHIISCHLKTRWTCKNCSKTYSRRDAMKKHAKDCQVA
ncbi:uncharacterized protein F5147DRAFT_35990 [Suillus discolor]|uniref:C2H2-type domain-containing protein n=1 Tax=Suillus discolor TaxID=1912936 RepID=A0A9P7JWT3_9AGAM|nr:uncharacterized protein F5147DRAFT_35990 [Suillus discolor]KAG2113874.1 hypothetical protein F5147DRAFT_35990 [Suillus discolor]